MLWAATRHAMLDAGQAVAPRDNGRRCSAWSRRSRTCRARRLKDPQALNYGLLPGGYDRRRHRQREAVPPSIPIPSGAWPA